MMKVYCKNCKYYSYHDDAFGGHDDCKYPIGERENWLHKYIDTIGDPITQNGNNDCKYYNRKLHYFWVKDSK